MCQSADFECTPATPSEGLFLYRHVSWSASPLWWFKPVSSVSKILIRSRRSDFWLDQDDATRGGALNTTTKLISNSKTSPDHIFISSSHLPSLHDIASTRLASFPPHPISEIWGRRGGKKYSCSKETYEEPTRDYHKLCMWRKSLSHQFLQGIRAHSRPRK